MLAGQPIPFFGDGTTRRDYTYIDDIIQGVRGAMDYEATRYEVVNLGNNQTVSLSELVRELEKALGVQAKIERLHEQLGDVPQTWADVRKAARLFGYKPSVDLNLGLERFAGWLTQT